MRVKLFTFRYSATLGGFDDTPLADFARDKELLRFHEHFFSVNDVPHILCVVQWHDAVLSAADLAATDAQGVDERAPAPVDSAAIASAWHTAPRRRGGRVARGERSARTERGERSDPTAGLDESQRLLFNTLRTWRSAKSREEGVPPFLVFNNRHLREIVTRLPDSSTALLNVAGVGPGKVKRYGAELLAVLHGRRAHGPASPNADGGGNAAASSTHADTDIDTNSDTNVDAESQPDTETKNPPNADIATGTAADDTTPSPHHGAEDLEPSL